MEVKEQEMLRLLVDVKFFLKLSLKPFLEEKIFY